MTVALFVMLHLTSIFVCGVNCCERILDFRSLSLLSRRISGTRFVRQGADSFRLAGCDHIRNVLVLGLFQFLRLRRRRTSARNAMTIPTPSESGNIERLDVWLRPGLKNASLGQQRHPIQCPTFILTVRLPPDRPSALFRRGPRTDCFPRRYCGFSPSLAVYRKE